MRAAIVTRIVMKSPAHKGQRRHSIKGSDFFAKPARFAIEVRPFFRDNSEVQGALA
jgi:hypothetical protein